MLEMILALNFVKYIIQLTACMVVNPIMVNNFASLFVCRLADRASDSMAAQA